MGGPSAWSVYLATDDAAATVDKARAAGAEVVAGPMAGRRTSGRWPSWSTPPVPRSAPGSRGPSPASSTRAEEGAPAWFETLSKDYAGSVRFYTDVFGWEAHTMSDTPELRYTTLGKDEDARAGIMDAPGFLGDQPSRWQFYLQVADTDATVEQALAAGASLVQPAEDTPYGRLALLSDPAGVQFSVMGPSSGS